MAGRPEKHTVDYFSHDARSGEGKTLTILFNHFGHEGISAWWLLLEAISSTNNHIISIGNTEDIEYLAAKLHFQPERLKEILDKMAILEAIDKDWYSKGYIWSENFVARVKPVYDMRKQKLPDIKTIVNTDNSINKQNNSISMPDITHTKVNKSKVNKTIVNNPEDVVFVLPEWVNSEIWAAFIEVRKKKKAIQTPHALKLITGELERLKEAGNDPAEVLRQSIVNSWKGVFPLKSTIQKEKSGWEGE